ncbi:CHAT domain-containing protein [Streptomyces sp. NBC_01198]|uniref:CHAT domain-containing protein n=1 Tax=Streptomyces sp. NBC_01198 TaxID=2903769 RepID=UPI002E157411|nr:CHAT domain-containing protein [Streptomyces sp. NBC_01198]
MSDLFVLAVDVSQRVVPEDEAVQQWLAGGAVLDADQRLVLWSVADMEMGRGNDDVAWTMAKLAEAGAREHAGASLASPWWQAADILVELTRRILCRRPDGRRLAEAVAVVERQREILDGRCRSRVARAARPREVEELAETLNAAGQLLATPYIENSARGWPSLNQWLSHENTAALTDPTQYLAGQSAVMPAPSSALAAAMDSFERGARLGKGHVKGLCLAYLATCHHVQAVLSGKPADRGRLLSALASRALVHLEEDRAPGLYARSLYFHLAFGENRSDASVRELLVRRVLERPPRSEDDVDDLLASLLPWAGPGLPRQLLAELWARVGELTGQNGNVPRRIAVCERVIHAFAENFASCPGSGSVSAPEAEVLAERIVSGEEHSPRERAATLVHLAVHLDTESCDLARSILSRSRDLDPAFSAEHFDCVDYAEANVSLDYGKSREEAGDLLGALWIYSDAAVVIARLARSWSWPEIVSDLLLRALRCVRDYSGDEPGTAAIHGTALAADLVPILPAVFDENRAGLYWSLGVVVERLMWRGFDSWPGLAHHHLFKGLEFSYAAMTPGPFPIPAPTARMLGELRELERREGPYVAGVDSTTAGALREGFPAEFTDLAYAGGHETSGRVLPRARASRLRRAVDHALTRSIEETAIRRGTPWQAVEHPHLLQRSLPEDTVLISLFLGERNAAPPGDLAFPEARTVGMWITREEWGCWRADLDEPGSAFSYYDPESGSSQTLHMSAWSVATVREAVREDAFGRPATQRTRRLLNSLYRELGGPNRDFLDHWYEKGCRHLCIWPHGPLHYLPYAVLENGGRPLADDWIVTTVPSDAVFQRAATVEPAGQARLLIVGPERGGAALGFAPQPLIKDHVRALARNYPESHLLGGDRATPRGVLEELSDATYLHIAAHGSHDAEAAWFQCLYLDGSDGDDGRLYAHDIVQCDLRHVSLVTLSACESAMGRFDRNDSLRGLPAAFMLAGAATVIGALWPIAPDVADTFFGQLYAELRRGTSKRDAYRSAQQTTRAAFPGYGDWGAFTFIGGL